MGVLLKKHIDMRRKKVPSEVKGPIRCHKCQLNCRDAAEYLNHKCEQQRSPNW